MKSLLMETYSRVKKDCGYNLTTPVGFFGMLADSNAFGSYLTGLSEGLRVEDKSAFYKMAKSTRKKLLENNVSFQLKPYESLTLPILRNFYPKLIAKELVNVMPIDKPDNVVYFVKPKFRKMIADSSGADYSDYIYNFPSTTDITRGPSKGISSTADATSSPFNILEEIGLDASQPSHIERDFKITGILDDTGAFTDVEIIPGVDGMFAKNVTNEDGDDSDDYVSGHIDWNTGILYWTSADGNVSGLRYKAYASLEQNSINPEVRFDMDKTRITVKERKLSSKWTPELEQDIKALFDITLQSELVNIMGEQLAMDIDREIINDLIDVNTTQNPSSHTDTFKKRPPSGFNLSAKQWHERILVNLNTLSAQIYNTTLMGQANTLACNPLDAAIFQSLNNFEYLGDATAGGEVGYRSATVAAGTWKLLVSSNVPAGKVIVKYRSEDRAKAVYVFAPYVPAMLMPYPLGDVPSMTILSRYATQVLRPGGVGILNISDTVSDVF